MDGMQFVTARGWEDLSSLMKVYEELDIPLTEESIREYLAHDEVAKDVAAYIDLYHKYEDHYGISEILEGHVKTSLYERLFRASFDEKISVVHLLLSGLHQSFAKAIEQKKLTDDWFDFLKRYRSPLMAGKDGVSTYVELCEALEENLALQKKQGFLEKKDAAGRQRLVEKIRRAIPDPQEIVGKIPEEVFELVRQPFAAEVTELERREKESCKKLEYAFDFVEAAFQEGQELVVFVTELAMDETAVLFLAENECERFQKYNQELLLGTKKAELLSELREGARRSEEHIRDF